jgi:hypothetical protein
MADFSVRADHIDVEQIMRQIRARIRDKRGADYTEDEIRELAAVKLEKFLDPRAVRSDLLQHYRKQHQPTPLILPEEAHPPLYTFTPDTVYVSDRGVAGRILTIIRKILKPFSKLFFHVDTVWDVLSKQSVLNAQHTRLFQRAHQRFITRDELDSLNFEMFNNLVVELTRLGIEVKNLRMQVESFGTRLDFDERRARALEGVVQYRPGATVAKPPPPAPAGGDEDEEEPIGAGAGGGEGGDALSRSARRRRRRRGRRRGAGGIGEGGGAGGVESRERSEGDGDSSDTDSSEGASEGASDTGGPQAAETGDWETVAIETASVERQYAEPQPRTAPEPEPAAAPFYETPPTPSISSGWAMPPAETPAPTHDVAPAGHAPDPGTSESAGGEPPRVFQRVFDRPRAPESPSTPAQDAPRSDDHEPSQS